MPDIPFWQLWILFAWTGTAAFVVVTIWNNRP